MKGSLECTFIGDQAKKLREYANLSHEDISSVSGLSVQDLINFECGELYSSEVINGLYQMYFSAVNIFCIRNNKSFASLLQEYCKDNDLDASLFETYCNSISESIINSPNKESSKRTINNFIKASDNALLLTYEASSLARTAMESSREAVNVAKDYRELYLSERASAIHCQEMLDILLDVVTSDSQYMKNKIIKLVKEEMVRDCDETEEMGIMDGCEYPSQYQRAAYVELIHELKTRWDFLKDK